MIQAGDTNLFDDRKIAFVGPGVMAEAMIAGLIRQGVAKPGALAAAGPREERLQELQAKYRIETYTDNAVATRQADVVVLSVKPQRLDRVLSGLRGSMHGSVDFYQRNEEHVHLARLRNQVTSPGGTSAEALYCLEKAGFRTAISRAIWAAYERSVELGKGGKTHPPEHPPATSE